ncbi:hypothetical protein ABFS82_13G096000 [Erythranthe guttata]
MNTDCPMERRQQQLDLNAPLLSARRYSSPSCSAELVKWKVLEKPPPPARQQSLPSKTSDWEYEDVCKPAAVPFHWEQIPGRPKNEAESQPQTPQEPSITPRLPPRLSGPTRFASGERSNDQGNIYRAQVEAFSFADHATLIEKLNDSLKCKDESESESQEEQDEDAAYSDALDTLSVTGSWSWNYSVSGISGCNSISGPKPSGNFCIDTNTRDFMMNRFLPAAKAAVLETPKKQQKVLVEQPKKPLFRKAVSGEIKPSPKQYYNEYVDYVESDDEIPNFKSNTPVKKTGKAWGIIPRFCVKNSMCLLNPLPGMKSKSRAPTPPKTLEVKRLTRNAHSGPLDKNACHVPQQRRFHSGLLSRDLPRMENKMSNDLNNKSGASQLRSISPYRNESPKSPFREGVGFLGVPKGVEDFNANKIASSRKLFKALHDVSRNQTSEKTGEVVEKKVYVESVNRKDQETPALDEGKKRNPNVELNRSVEKEEEEKLELDPLLKPSSPLAPPLPKSPSESWLWRTLPSISLGNPFAHSRRNFHLQSKKQGQKLADAKWETIVKTTNIRHDHVRYSQELVPHVTHRQSKS